MLNLGNVLADARNIVTRLQDQDKVSDGLICQATTINEKINCMKQYQDEVHHLNQAGNIRARPELVLSLQKETRQIRALQEENRELSLSLEAHQAALELVMAKYRAQMLRFIHLRPSELKLCEQLEHARQKTNSIESMEKRQLEFAAVFSESLKMGTEQASRQERELTQLRVENETLRELLAIASRNDASLARTFAQRLESINSHFGDNESPVQSDSPDDPVTPTTSTSNPKSPVKSDDSGASTPQSVASPPTVKKAPASVQYTTKSKSNPAITRTPTKTNVAAAPRIVSTSPGVQKPKVGLNEKGSSNTAKRRVSSPGVASPAGANRPNSLKEPVGPRRSVDPSSKSPSATSADKNRGKKADKEKNASPNGNNNNNETNSR